MNNYSWLQKKLHILALRSNLIKKTSFSIESRVFSSNLYKDKHVFIAGLARSGSTILMNAIYKSDQFGSLSYDDMPFVLSPNLWAKISSFKTHSLPVERSHQDNIMISTSSPEAFEEIFWSTYKKEIIEIDPKFQKFISCVLIKTNKDRYLSKNNQNILRLNEISRAFPKSHILIPYRNPIQQSFSLLNNHIKFINDAKQDPFVKDYMELTCHSEFGPVYKQIQTDNIKFRNDKDINHWLEQWYLNYSNILNIKTNNKNIHFINYEQLCLNPALWRNISEKLDLDKLYEFDFKLSEKKIKSAIDSSLHKKSSELYKDISMRSL